MVADSKPWIEEWEQGHLSFIDVRLAAPLAAGNMPSITLTMVNDGHSIIDNINGPYQGIVGPSLPNCTMSEFNAIGNAHGTPTPTPDLFFSGSLEPSEDKKTIMNFPKLALVLRALGTDYVRRLGTPTSAPGLPTVTPSAFFFGFVDYKTLGKAFRKEFCYTLKDHRGVELEEYPQWNRTVPLSVALNTHG